MTITANILVLLLFYFGIAQDIPYCEGSSYKLSLKMGFKVQPTPSNDKIDFGNIKNDDISPQMYLNASLELLYLKEEDFKIKIMNSDENVLISKKLKIPDTFIFKLGFAHHMKAQESPNSFIIYFINKEKKITSQIVLDIKENGDFMVNGKRFGNFNINLSLF